MNKQDAADVILIGLEKSSNLIDRCAVYESVYFKEGTTASKNLEGTILHLYIAILKYGVKAIKASKSEFFLNAA
jgi:hypothetical protein